MSALVPTSQTLPSNASMPPLSPGLRGAIEAWQQPAHPDIGRRQGPRLTPAQRGEAERALAEIDHLCRPADRALVLRWLQRLGAGVRNPPAPDDFRVRAAAVVEACDDLPHAAWTAASCAEAMRRFDWWPSVSQLHSMLSEWVRPVWSARHGLRVALDASQDTRPPAPRPPDDAAREAVRATVAACVAEIDARAAPPMPAERVTPRFLSDGQLLAIYEASAAAGNRAAATRAEALRRKLECGADVMMAEER